MNAVLFESIEILRTFIIIKDNERFSKGYGNNRLENQDSRSMSDFLKVEKMNTAGGHYNK